MRAYVDVLDLLAGIVVGGAAGTYGGLRLLRGVAREQVEEYKARWKSVLNLLHTEGRITDEQLARLGGEEPPAVGTVVNGWRMETYGQKARLGGQGEFVTVIAIRLKKGSQTLEVRPSREKLGLRPWDDDFDEQMRAYREKATTVARNMP